MTKHFVRIRDLGQSGAYRILCRAQAMKEQGFCGNSMEGKVAALLFEKASTQSRISFETAVRHLGGRTLFMPVEQNPRGRSESLPDTLRLLSGHVDCLVTHTFDTAMPRDAPVDSPMPVINGFSPHGHPCQVMADLLAIVEDVCAEAGGGSGPVDAEQVDWNKVRVACVGDGSCAANSWIEAALYFPFELFMAVPEGYEPDAERLGLALQAGAKIFLTRDPHMAVDGAQYVHADLWPLQLETSSALSHRESGERLAPGADSFKAFQVDAKLMALAAPGARLLHSLPALHGEEVSDEVFAKHSASVFRAAENRIWIQMAVLEWFFE